MSTLIDLVQNVKIDDNKGVIHFLDPQLDEEVTPAAITMKLEKLVFELKNNNITASFSNDQIHEMDILHNIGGEKHVYSALYNESLQSKETQIYTEIKELAKKSEFETRTDFRKLMFKWFGYEPKDHISELSPNDLSRKIMVYCNKIASKSRTGPGNFIIVGNRLGSIISDSNLFTFSNINNDPWVNGFSYQIGTLTGNIKVIVNPYLEFNNDTIVIGKTTQKNNQGVYLIEKNERNIDKFVTDQHHTKIVLYESFKVVSTPKAHLNYHMMTVTGNKHTLLTFLWIKLKNKIKGNGK